MARRNRLFTDNLLQIDFEAGGSYGLERETLDMAPGSVGEDEVDAAFAYPVPSCL